MSVASPVLRPPIPYFGGKQTIAQRVITEMPGHKHYVEPFCGSLAVLLAKEPVAHETVNDLDGDLVNFWRVLRDQPEALARVCALTPHSRGEFSVGCRSSVVLSGYPSELYDDALAGWRRIEIPTNTGQGGQWSERTEVLWINRPAVPGQLDIFDLLDAEAVS